MRESSLLAFVLQSLSERKLGPRPVDKVPAARAARRNPPAWACGRGRSLAGALAIAFRLVRIDLAHALEQIARVRFGNIGRFRPVAAAFLRPPRRGAYWSLRPLRHDEKFRIFC